MTSIDIYSILQSKPHNPHYLNRYWKFIQYCQANPPNDTYLEEHHICPKAKDLFPEYTCLSTHRWNSVFLQARKHIIAHVLLWKAYKNASQTSALNYMLNVQNQDTISFNRRNVPPSLIRYSAQARQEYYTIRKGTAVYKDKDGNTFLLETKDPRIEKEGLVGILHGHKMSTVQKDKMRRAKDDYRKITLHFMTYERTLYLTDPEFVVLIDYGWTPYMQPERYELKKESAKQGAQKAMIGKNRFYRRDGTYYGMLTNDDPLIGELDLVHIRSEKQKAQAAEQFKKNAQNKEMQARKGKTLSTRKWFHDPVTNKNKRLIECPDGWKEGRAPSDNSVAGTETWNDGIRCYRVRDKSEIQPGWVKGMIPRKNNK